MRETSIFKTDLGPPLNLITLATIFCVSINNPQLGAQQLPDSAISIDSLTVTVLRGSDAINQTPYAISIRDQVDLQLGNTGLSLEEALQGLPGVQVQNRYNYAVGERISIRGFGARAGFGVRGIKVIVDGIPATMADGQSTLDHVDIGSLGRAEVLRGPASALYGSGSGGVLSLHTAEAPNVITVSLMSVNHPSWTESMMLMKNSTVKQHEGNRNLRPLGWCASASTTKSTICGSPNANHPARCPKWNTSARVNALTLTR